MGRTLLSLGLLSLARIAFAQGTATPIELHQPVDRPLGPGGKEEFRLPAEAGQFFHIRAQQKGVEVVIAILAPGGARLVSSASPNNGFGLVDASFVAKDAGDYRVEVADKGDLKLQGTVVVELLARRTSSKEDLDRIEAEDLFRTGLRLDGLSTPEKRRAADGYTKAADLYERLKEPYWRALCLHRLGLTVNGLGESRKSLEIYDQVLSLRRAIGDRAGEGQTLNNIGVSYGSLSERQKSIDSYNQALVIHRSVGNRPGESLTLNNLGNAYRDVGEHQKSLESFNGALTVRRALGDRSGEASTLGSIGFVYRTMGESPKSLDAYNQALSVRRAMNDRSGEGYALNDIANVSYTFHDYRKALEVYDQARSKFRDAGIAVGEALVLRNIGGAYLALGEKQKALESYTSALPLYRSAGDHANEALVLRRLGVVQSELGEKAKALEFYNQALAVSRANGDHPGEALALRSIGGFYSAPEERQKALDAYNGALAVYRAAADSTGEAETLYAIGDVYRDSITKDKSLLDKALEKYNQALMVYRAKGDRSAEARTLHNIGAAYSNADDNKKALEFMQQALPVYRAAGDRAGEGHILRALGVTYEDLGDNQKAIEFLDQALPIHATFQDNQAQVWVLDRLCPLLRRTDATTRLATCYTQTLAVKKALGDEYEIADTLVDLAKATEELDPKAAAGHFEEALALYRKTKSRSMEVDVLQSLARVYTRIGEHQKAYEYQRLGLGKVQALLVAVGGGQQEQAVAEVAAALKKLGAEVRTVSGAEATSTNIADQISKIADASEPSDSVVLMYSGTGSLLKTEYRLATRKGSGTAPDGINANLLRAWINRLPVRSVLICLDVPAEKGLDAFELKVSGAGDALSELTEKDVLLIGPATNIPLRAAARPDPSEPLLGKALARSLSAEADRNRDGFLNYPEIEVAVTANMLALQLEDGLGGSAFQRPQAYGSEGTNLIFATGVAPDASVSRGGISARVSVSDEVKREFGGRYYALVIATNEYDQWNKLSNPLFDAEEAARELHDRYGFETEIVPNPTKEEFINRFAMLKKKQFGPDDELLIFIAGHGTYDETEKTGYLIAKNSLREDEAHNSHISQQQIFNIVSGLKVRHVFVVIDACFGGAIAGLKRDDPKSDITYAAEAKLQALRRKRSDRTLIFLTSGGKEYVPDGKPGAHSPFAFQFLRALKSKTPGTQDSILTFLDFMSFADQVQNAPQPKYGWFPEADPASDFWLFADPELRNINVTHGEQLTVKTEKQ